MRRLLASAFALGAVLLLAACGDDGGGGATGPCRDGTSGEVTIVAEDIAWDVDCIDATADELLVVTIDNQDEGVLHNLNLRDAPGNPKTELEKGLVTQTLDVTLPAGDYDYICDIHPNMLGTLHMVSAS